MMKFVVTAESDVMEICSETNDAEEATELFEYLCESRDPIYHTVYLYDGKTGEVYASQTIIRDPAGVTISKWVAL